MGIEKIGKNELYVLKKLWSAGQPLAAADFLEGNNKLAPRSLQATYKTLLKKGYIEEVGKDQGGGTGMAYRAAITRQEYKEMRIAEKVAHKSGVFSQFAADIEDEEVFDAIEDLLRRRREEAEKEKNGAPD